MRGKVAKSLRNIALERTVGKPWEKYKKIIQSNGNVTSVLDKTCGKSVYRRLKKYIKGESNGKNGN